jgi:hypothetical protein
MKLSLSGLGIGTLFLTSRCDALTMSLITDNTTAFKALLIELGEKPILAQTLTMSAFCGLGDFLAQTNSMRTSSTSVCYDWKRVAKFACKGIGCGIIWSHWFMLAEIWSTTLTVWILQQHHVDVKLFAIVRTIVNLLLEQFIACPLIFGLWDLPIISLMDGKPLIKIPGIVRQKLIKLLIANAKLWTVANVVIYNAPLNLRVLLVSLADLFWESIVSTVASKHEEENDDEEMEIMHGKVRLS